MKKVIPYERKMLHNIFFVAPVDKANGNVFFVCQRHYAQFFINELRLTVNNITSTYVKTIKPEDKTVTDNTSFLKKKNQF